MGPADENSNLKDMIGLVDANDQGHLIFYDDVSGKILDEDKVHQARDEELEEISRCNVYTKVPPCPQESKPFYAPETFSKECETVLGIICRHQCNTLSQLYDIWDYRVYPPRMSQRKTDVTLDECVACLQDQDCAQRPITHDQEGIHLIDYTAWGGVSKSALMPDRVPEQQ